MSNYPDNVNESMIDYYFGEGDARCANCAHFNDGICLLKEADLQMDYTDDELIDMGEKEYLSKV